MLRRARLCYAKLSVRLTVIDNNNYNYNYNTADQSAVNSQPCQ